MLSSPDPATQAEQRSPDRSETPFGMTIASGRYKSLASPLSWGEIPLFAILSGLNGSGKTQLLELIAMQFDTQLKQRLRGNDVSVAFSGHNYNPHDVFYIPQFDLPLTHDSISLSHYNEQLNSFRQPNNTSPHDRFIAQQAQVLPPDDFPFDSLYYNLHFVDRAIAHQFLQFLVRDGNLTRKGKDRTALGDPPWDEINTSLQRSGFPYRFIEPEDLSALKPLRLELMSNDTGDIVLLRDLSSGEASLLRFLLFAFAASKMDGRPKLFLLDEPDAHLHCGLIQSFLMGVQTVLIENFGFRIVMTTHRTETLALAPEEALYEMHRSGARIRKSQTKSRAISMLTGSLVAFVYGGRRAVVVEDVQDVAFYRSVFGILRKNAEWRSPIDPEFLSASWLVEIRGIRSDDLRTSKRKPDEQDPKGGRGNVKVVCREFNALGFQDIVFGLVDQDGGDATGISNIVRLMRYSIENYLIDPLYMYVYLLNEGRELPVSRPVELGREAELREWADVDLQGVADVVCEGIRSKLTPIPKDQECRRVEILYTNGRAIDVPLWLMERRGKDLFHAARSFASPFYFGIGKLEVAMQRVGLIPVELCQALEAAVGYIRSEN